MSRSTRFCGSQEVFAWVFCDKNIGGLDVALDDPLGVSGVESVGDLNAQTQNGFDLRGFPASLRACPFKQFHRDERAAWSYWPSSPFSRAPASILLEKMLLC
jgi:hypothetical protein